MPNYIALEHIESEPERDGILNGETGLERSHREAIEGSHLRQELQEREPKILLFRLPIVSDAAQQLARDTISGISHYRGNPFGFAVGKGQYCGCSVSP